MSIKDLTATRRTRSQQNSKPSKEDLNMESYEITSEESHGSDTNSEMTSSDAGISVQRLSLNNQPRYPHGFRPIGITVDPVTGIPSFGCVKPGSSASSHNQATARQIHDRNSCTYDIQESVQAALDDIRGEEECVDEAKSYEIIDSAYHKIWATLEADFDYVMSRTEYAVFNYFQARHRGNPRAVSAQRLYWSNY